MPAHDVFRRAFRRLGRDRRAAAALEFALVSVPFLGIVLGLATVAVDLYLQEALDVALQTAVRQVQLGRVPTTSSASDFTGSAFCPAFTAFAPCTGVSVTLQPVSDYVSAAVVATPSAAQLGSSGSFCVGRPGQLMFARVVYLAPIISRFWPYAGQASINGVTGTALVSTAAFANENPSGVALPGSAGC